MGTCWETTPYPMLGSASSPCHGATSMGAFSNPSYCGSVPTSPVCDASARTPAGGMGCGSFQVCGSPTAWTDAWQACGIVSTSPIASKSMTSAVGNGRASQPWNSAAGSPAADALRSLFHGRGLSSYGGADLAAQLQA